MSFVLIKSLVVIIKGSFHSPAFSQIYMSINQLHEHKNIWAFLQNISSLFANISSLFAKYLQFVCKIFLLCLQNISSFLQNIPSLFNKIFPVTCKIFPVFFCCKNCFARELGLLINMVGFWASFIFAAIYCNKVGNWIWQLNTILKVNFNFKTNCLIFIFSNKNDTNAIF